MQAIVTGFLIPFAGTTLGAALVYFMKNQIKVSWQKALSGFAAGVMVAASIWSLIIPAIDMNAAAEKLAVLPSAAGFWLGILFRLLLDVTIPHLHTRAVKAEGHKSKLQKNIMLVLDVALA